MKHTEDGFKLGTWLAGQKRYTSNCDLTILMKMGVRMIPCFQKKK